MSSVNNKSHLKIPIFDGTDYPFWKERMKICLRAIDDDMWHVVQHGYMTETPGYLSPWEKRLVQIDAQAKDEIYDHLERNSFDTICLTLQNKYGTSLNKLMRVYPLIRKLASILFMQNSTISKGLEMEASSK